MAIDPRTPVIVGAGQVTVAEGDAPEPVALLAEAARRAADDSGSPRILAAVQSVRVVQILSRRYPDPGALVAQALGARPHHTAYTFEGGQSPHALVNRTAADILAGSLDVALIGGAEAWRTRTAWKSRGGQPPWPGAKTTGRPTEMVGSPAPMIHPYEEKIGLSGLSLLVAVYPMFESAWRASQGLSPEAHRQGLGELWARFSRVAAGNPYAAVPEPVDGATIATPTPRNRIIGWPYTKLMCANSMVDQAAALFLCSQQAADELGVAPERRVYIHAGIGASDTQFVSHRRNLCSSPALRAAGAALAAGTGIRPSGASHVDLYSCFPVAVQIAAAELGLAPGRDLTVTGGLTFAGGPWNNYATHGLATMVERLRAEPESFGVCTAVGGLLTKHCVGLYSTAPPAVAPLLATVTVDDEGAPLAEGYEGPATLEAFTVMHDRCGTPERAFATARLDDDGPRTWATSTDPAVLAALLADDPVGAPVTVGPAGALGLSGLR